jgi:Relaxase/Mobilisation nuclease domain
VIGQITKGSGFGKLINYLLRPDKDAEILGTSACCETPNGIAREFELICSRNPLVSRTVTHISIAFANEDGVIDRDTKIKVGEKIIEALGHSNGHYLMVAHGRFDHGHRHDHDHDHMHIALTSVDFDGKRIGDAWNFQRLEKALRVIETEQGFRQIPSSWEAKRSAPTRGQKQRFDREVAEGKDAVLPVSDRLQAAVICAAVESQSVGEMAQRLAHQNIESRLNITRTGKLRGISYQMEGVSFQGSQLYDASLPKLQSVHGLTLKSDDLSKLRQGMEFLRSLPLPDVAVVPEPKVVVNFDKQMQVDRATSAENNLEKEAEKVAQKKIKKAAVRKKKSKKQRMQM